MPFAAGFGIFSAATEKIWRPSGAKDKNDKRFLDSIELVNGRNTTILVFDKQIGFF
ncbi:MAG: hypothetical protein K9L59_11195 [Desulfobacterales bacterium]|nr:hypothetical protein [Desulfobacterales bacterium]